jgi:FkbM family methyltransferase
MKHFAQLDQDAWIEDTFPPKYKGYFVDIGAATGVWINNTYYLENDLGWKGICVEPNPESFSELKISRKCPIFNLAVADKDSKAKFTIKGEMSQIVFDNAADNRDIFGGGPSNKIIEIETVTPTELLKRANAPTVIDYLSLDTEGNERQILSVFPFHLYKVRAITVEHNAHRQGAERKNSIKCTLYAHGFELSQEDVEGFEDWYIHPENMKCLRQTA